MAASVTPLRPGSFDGTDATQSLIRAYFTVTPSGSYTTLGDTLDLTPLNVTSGYNPLLVVMRSAKAGGVSGNTYAYTPASSSPTQANGKFQAFVAAGTEVPAGAYPAGVTGDTIIGYADFIKL
jgi:hypothetical protein